MNTLMIEHFGRKLDAIRSAARTRQTERRARRREASVDRARHLLAGLDAVERMQRTITRLVEELDEELVSGVQLHRRFYDGRWSVVVCLDELVVGATGRPRVLPTRATFLFEPQVRTGRLALECHVTVRGADMSVTRSVDTLSEEGLARLADCVERRLLELAAHWAGTIDVT